MERLNRILDKAIIVLGKNGYADGSYTDLYVRRFISLYNHPGNKILDKEHCDGGITQELTKTEAAAIKSADVSPKVKVLAKL